ncbi:Putative prophage protein (ps3) [Alloactinosynnema sp. L-07]|uniref:type II toxin-antitoxin system antitoxin SocA domain-containing protein n=1 Tax=Alloactinosynnema sp. L-07 TaxID=1653480 RepID=UPI00065EFAC7|nr:type II toxin-antitoxin system antitoxin SocA domain-containing protein [Alloactinosynnema sp. L-07]CRK59838.1 Putative prophage protein (ps3) [Alloactinosynnema sp. L-07]
MADVHDVAAAILAETGPDSPMRLQKLLYYVQGWHLATSGKPVFPDRIEAWRAGPVVPEVYKHHEGKREVACWDEGDPDRLDSEYRETVRWVVARYAGFDRHQLSAMTHDEEPWRVARAGLSDDEPSSEPLSEQVMAAYFGRLTVDSETAIAQAVANARLEGMEVSAEAIDYARAVGRGEMTTDEAVRRRIKELVGR